MALVQSRYMLHVQCIWMGLFSSEIPEK